MAKKCGRCRRHGLWMVRPWDEDDGPDLFACWLHLLWAIRRLRKPGGYVLVCRTNGD